ncbi:hypothetical protein [Sporomusa silvacetica]|uniref:hypothetical protein n=1 Tax=Sporomusa silvacetica TaxID=55504 RepID=UPI0035A184DB
MAQVVVVVVVVAAAVVAVAYVVDHLDLAEVDRQLQAFDDLELTHNFDYHEHLPSTKDLRQT